LEQRKKKMRSEGENMFSTDYFYWTHDFLKSNQRRKAPTVKGKSCLNCKKFKTCEYIKSPWSPSSSYTFFEPYKDITKFAVDWFHLFGDNCLEYDCSLKKKESGLFASS